MAPRKLSVKVFDSKGKVITKSSKNYISYFELGEYGRKKEIKSEEIKDDNGFSTALDWGDFFIITIENKKEKMIIHAQQSIDSIPFMPGEFYFNRSLSYLLKIIPSEGISLENFSWDVFKISTSTHRIFELIHEEEDDHVESPKCYNIAKKIEDKHGGKNWARNVCNDVYEDFSISNDTLIAKHLDSLMKIQSQYIRTNVYPLTKNRFIRHNFYLGKSYDHDFSLSEDGVNWKTILTLKNEWYVNLVFFPDEEKVGIDISNAGVVLISDYRMKSWKYYLQNESEKEYNGKTDAFIFSNGNWMDAYPAKFYFSE